LSALLFLAEFRTVLLRVSVLAVALPVRFLISVRFVTLPEFAGALLVFSFILSVLPAAGFRVVVLFLVIVPCLILSVLRGVLFTEAVLLSG
jgi:hypothetical protein